MEWGIVRLQAQAYTRPMNKGVTIFWLIILALLALGIGASFMVGARAGQYDTLAQCIKDKGAVFYGAFWCPHCAKTKQMFGSSAKLLPYTECSTADGKGQTQICIDKKIQSYPTWIRPDGTTLNGEHTLKEIADFAGCQLAV